MSTGHSSGSPSRPEPGLGGDYIAYMGYIHRLLFIMEEHYIARSFIVYTLKL